MSAERPDEQALRDARLSKLYRESGALEPSAQIDQAILAAARREVHAGPRRLGHWMRQWRVPVSIAATVVVSATLVMVMVEEGADRLESPPPVASAPALKELPAPQTAPMQDSTPRGAALPDERGKQRGEAPAPPSTQESDSAASRQALKNRSKPEPAPEARPKRELEPPEARPPGEAPRAQPAPPPPALARSFPATPPAPEAARRAEVEDRAASRPESVAPPRAAEAPARDAQGGRVAGGLSARRERADDAGSTGIRALTDAPLAEGQQGAPSQDAIGRAAPSEPQKARGPDPYAQERADAAATAPAPAAKRAPSVQAAPKPKPESRGAVLARDLADQPPEKWLARVEQLRREERSSDADQLMAEFRRRFPDHPAAHRVP